MQKRPPVILLLLFALALTACSAATGPAQPPAETAATDTPAPVVEDAAETTSEDEGIEEEAGEEEAGEEITAETETAETDRHTFTIAPDQSEVRFVIDEVLRGTPTTVVGVNSGVTGEVTVDLSNPADTQIGTIEVDAAGFVTPESQRNNAIRRFILQSSQFPVVTFAPTSISGVPDAATVGDSFHLQVSGDLTILNSTNGVTFDVTANVISESELHISGATTINRADYGISIPSVPFVASVDEDLALELDLVLNDTDL